MPGLFELTAAFAACGHAVVMATNQSGIGRGLYDPATFARLNDWMRAEIGKNGGRLDAIYYAPTHPTEAKGNFRRVSEWRKPGSGMFFQAAHDLSLDLSRSVSIGNERRDIDALQDKLEGPGNTVNLLLYSVNTTKPINDAAIAKHRGAADPRKSRQ